MTEHVTEPEMLESGNTADERQIALFDVSAIRRVQWFTVAWMTIEVVVALIAAIRAHSVALAAFGGDSAIELLSAAVVLARFRATRGISERLATKITGWLLVALAAYIAAHSLYTLLARNRSPKSVILELDCY